MTKSRYDGLVASGVRGFGKIVTRLFYADPEGILGSAFVSMFCSTFIVCLIWSCRRWASKVNFGLLLSVEYSHSCSLSL